MDSYGSQAAELVEPGNFDDTPWPHTPKNSVSAKQQALPALGQMRKGDTWEDFPRLIFTPA
jgi:hypothetical protein